MMSKIASLRALPVAGKKVLMRVDFNVPLDKQGNIVDDTRIVAALPSIQYILDKGGAVVLMSHLGRPKGKVVPQCSLVPCAERLSALLGKPVEMAPECTGEAIEQKVKQLKPGQVLLLENLRFHIGEEDPEADPAFVRELAKLGDFYVNDAFGTAHRAHSSTAVIARYFPGKAAAGFLLEKEMQFIGEHLRDPVHPFYAIIGGAKISTKIGVLKVLLRKVEALLIGGGMAYTFMKAKGIAIGESIYEEALLEEARAILQEGRLRGIPILLPQDIVVVKELKNESMSQTIEAQKGIPDGFQGVDIGPKTIQSFIQTLQNAKTVFWNGPMGVFEIPQFATGTNAIATALAALSATTIVGGGESVAAVEAAGVAKKMSHISTGGGATLEYIEFGTLPGIEALRS
jgi:phosphoglycerate kinase